ncbi:hypothetical protein OHB12_25250 [Nocardia sp. NBC_01730]|uniref:hypothetical protein n=1 Tax=Nocardia sp. NBC_01730 TaxID=2975998 RepID=UPI002E146C6C|nr:hypothetical protein OHB12_25250 [Nocardia sp. NBC_01730]
MATIPLNAYDRLPAADLAGKTVIDTMNYYPQRDGRVAVLDSAELTSSALVQRHLSGSRVVKAFNNIDFRRLLTSARPSGAADRSALPIADDDAAAKAEVAALLNALGYDAVDIGAFADSCAVNPAHRSMCSRTSLRNARRELTQDETYRWFLETPGVAVLPAE